MLLCISRSGEENVKTEGKLIGRGTFNLGKRLYKSRGGSHNVNIMWDSQTL